MTEPVPGSLLKLRWRAARMLVPRRTVQSRGLSFTLQCDNWITHYRWRSYNDKEPETLDWIDRWVRAGETFFDIGANIGLYTLYAALRDPKVRVLAFEPEYANLHLLRDNIFENKVQDRVQIYSIALGNSTGVSFLHIQDRVPGSALHTENQQTISMTQMQKPVIFSEGICTMTLDAFCEQTGVRPHCMKVDVDGTEQAILEGAGATLRSEQLRSLIIEFPCPEVRESGSRLLEEAGLRCAWRDPKGTSSNEVWVREGKS